ncbi:MAG: AlpA family phage regulatory protein [Alphaproteobacteria bacterium]|nr:AlpA family phage regulatory protein [Alphaproteobacteria bacterium]
MDEQMQRKRILRFDQVHALTGMSRTQIYTRDDFPKPIKLGPRASGWIAGEVLDWIDARAAMREAS